MLQIQFEGNLVDYIKFQARYSVPLELSDGELTLIAYKFLHGDNAVEQFVNDGHSKSNKSVENYLSTLRKKGIIIGKGLNPDLYLTKDSNQHFYTFKVDESKVV